MTAQFIANLLLGAMTPLIAIIALCVAYQQHKTNQFRLRHELYERRLRVYRSVQSFLSEIVRDGSVRTERISQFYAEASESVFLFDKAIQKHVDMLHSKAIDLGLSHEKLYPTDGSPGVQGEERGTVSTENNCLLKWMSQQLPESKELFRKHMGIK